MNNFVNFEFFFTKLSGIYSCINCVSILGGHAWRNFFMDCSKLEAMAVYVVKQACGNDTMASVQCMYEICLHCHWLGFSSFI